MRLPEQSGCFPLRRDLVCEFANLLGWQSCKTLAASAKLGFIDGLGRKQLVQAVVQALEVHPDLQQQVMP